MAKYIRTSKADFERFKKAFLKYVKLFGLVGYRITFYHEPLDENYARIYVDEEAKYADVQFSKRFLTEGKKGYSGPEGEAKHEALHLLTSRLKWLGKCRFIISDAFDEEWEKLVRILEKIIE